MSLRGPADITLNDIMNAGGRVLRNDWTHPVKDFVRRRGRKFLRDLRRYEASLKAGSAATRGREFLIEHSFAGRFCALLLNYPKVRKTPTAKGAMPLTLAGAKTMASQVETRHCSGETVHVKVQGKPDGGTRYTCSFGPRWRAANLLADTFLAIRWGENPLEFSRRGRGRDAAIRQALEAYKNGGVRSFVHADVQNFYPSIDKEALIEFLPLPRSMTKNVLTIPDEGQIEIHNVTTSPGPEETAVRAGIPQGSRPSARIASNVLRTALGGLELPLLFFHGDDVLVGLKANADTKATKSALASALLKHPAGPLLLKQNEPFQLNEGHDYLGYELAHRRKKFGGYAKARPSKKAVQRFHSRSASKIALLPHHKQSEAMAELVRSWCASFGAWSGKGYGLNIAIGAAVNVLAFTGHFRSWLDEQKPMSLEKALDAFKEKWLPHLGKNAFLCDLPS